METNNLPINNRRPGYLLSAFSVINQGSKEPLINAYFLSQLKKTRQTSLLFFIHSLIKNINKHNRRSYLVIHGTFTKLSLLAVFTKPIFQRHIHQVLS